MKSGELSAEWAHEQLKQRDGLRTVKSALLEADESGLDVIRIAIDLLRADERRDFILFTLVQRQAPISGLLRRAGLRGHARRVEGIDWTDLPSTALTLLAAERAAAGWGFLGSITRVFQPGQLKLLSRRHAREACYDAVSAIGRADGYEQPPTADDAEDAAREAAGAAAVLAAPTALADRTALAGSMLAGELSRLPPDGSDFHGIAGIVAVVAASAARDAAGSALMREQIEWIVVRIQCRPRRERT